LGQIQFNKHHRKIQVMPVIEASDIVNYLFALDNMIETLPPIRKKEYDTETRQLTIYCTDGTVYRLQMVQIN